MYMYMYVRMFYVHVKLWRVTVRLVLLKTIDLYKAVADGQVGQV